MKKIILFLFLVIFWSEASFGDPVFQQEAQENTLIPLEVLFKAPDYTTVRLSPDGDFISYLRSVGGIQNIWLARTNNISAVIPLTHSKTPITNQMWALTNKHILYTQDRNGNENWHLYVVNIETGKARDLTPFKGVQVRILGQSVHQPPEEVVIALNKRRKDYYDYYIVNILTGKLTRIKKNNTFVDMWVDDDYQPCLGEKANEDGGYTIFKKEKGKWVPFFEISPQDAPLTTILGYDSPSKTIYLVDSSKSNTTSLVAMNYDTGARTILGNDPQGDIYEIYDDPMNGSILGFTTEYTKEKYFFLDKEFKEDLEYLRSLYKGEVRISSMRLDKKVWVVCFITDTTPPKYYLYDRAQKKAQFLFSLNKELDTYSLCPMKPIIIKARDGVDLVSYLTLPCGRNEKNQPIPLVLVVHGGPQSRDKWGYNVIHQWLANRGYAALSVNFRGSTGFGKNFVNAGNGEWGAKMQDDLTDAVNWAIEQGIADKNRVAIMGTSYGGYATLAGLTFTPDLYACGVDICGRSNLLSKFTDTPEYWKPIENQAKVMMGTDPDTQEGQALLKQRSPLFYADKIRKPLLIVHGLQDPRVKKKESDHIVEALKKRKVPYIYLVYPKEGHGLRKPENVLTLYENIGAFFAQYLGGEHLPLESIELAKKSEFIKQTLP